MGSWELLSLVFKQPPLPMVIYPTCGNVRATGEGGKYLFRTHVWWSLCWERFSVRWLWFPCPATETRAEEETVEEETRRQFKSHPLGTRARTEVPEGYVMLIFVLTSPAISWKIVLNCWSSSLSSPAEAGAGWGVMEPRSRRRERSEREKMRKEKLVKNFIFDPSFSTLNPPVCLEILIILSGLRKELKWKDSLSFLLFLCKKIFLIAQM